MKLYNKRQNSLQQSGAEGLLLMLAAVPFIFSPTATGNWQIIAAGFSSLICLLAAWSILRHPSIGKPLAGIAATSCLIPVWSNIISDPSTALIAAVVYVFALYSLFDFSTVAQPGKNNDKVELGLQRTRWAALALIGISLASFLIFRKPTRLSETSLLIISVLAQLLSISWSISQQSNFHKMFCILLNTLTLLAAFYLSDIDMTWIGSLAIGITLLLFLPESAIREDNAGNWWDMLVTHPARATLFTFLLLCLLGSFLLFMPVATALQPISFIDAAFTSVSAVCVTGLIVLDTPKDFSLPGQAFILLLIQLGGIGIMTVTTLALHAMGRRISIRQARTLNTTINSDYQSLFGSIKQIVKFTVIAEIAGAIILAGLFFQSGTDAYQAVWKGLFTSISAFCNAGFALQSDSLIGFQNNPLILHTVALLIIVGGLAPAVVLMLPAWFRGKAIPVAARLALITTVILLVFGCMFYLAFEWNNTLYGLSIPDKIHNAWFQSVTLRTAGFNSVAIENVIGPTFLVMICMMFIGGSPGGTAGGVKTTTFGVLLATFWACVLGYDEVALQNRRIMAETIFKAITTVVAGAVVMLTVTLMLEVTQITGSRDLIFEAASALGTVGLSLGATAKLDNIGKIIIMLAMFIGRIGPVTLFALLSRERYSNTTNLLDARINLT